MPHFGLLGYLDDTWAWIGWAQVTEVQVIGSYVGVILLTAFVGSLGHNNREPYRGWWARMREGMVRVPVQSGVVSERSMTRHLKVGRQEVLTFPGDKGKRFIRVERAYWVDIINPMLETTFDEVSDTQASWRRYEDYGVSWNRLGSNPVEPLRLYV